MKQLKLAMLAMFAFLTFSNVNAQDENNPWVVGFGLNTVDPRIPTEFGDYAQDYIGTGEWADNTLPSISRISVERYLADGFTLQLAGSINKVKTFISEDDVDELYWAIDLAAKWDLNHLFGETGWFDPYVYLGGGYTDFGRIVGGNFVDGGEGTLNAGVGFNVWFNENIGLNFQTGGKKEFADNIQDHFQHSLGVVFRFGGKDTDGDGVYDKDDACPEVAGLKEFNGCPDADGDGIKDSDDACPNEAGVAALNGCPDADGDGIADKDDACPTVAGTKAMNGCPDADGDGIADNKDKCPNEAGPADNGGCPWGDKDNDGVKDNVDKCPDVAGVASRQGCPEPKPVITEEAKKKLDEFARAIYFNSGRTSFRPGVKGKLDLIAGIMKEYKDANFNIEGHTDSQGAAKANQKLSERRAKAVLDYLATHGVTGSRLSSVGFGEDYPIATNKTRAGRAQNRRVEINLRK
ncbi:OmpA family protein [Tenacibaculum sp. M341]|uniref:OmpA family protein n=1 Tax=Tenacibaculum sp. M341 TaxID=2530339 RepID=UPI001045F76E|nr:OmpA family protein [Tenacibaculum sp. M341]TCI84966.1 OmpA family protein [Tenacibaculum sp. M341]